MPNFTEDSCREFEKFMEISQSNGPLFQGVYNSQVDIN